MLTRTPKPTPILLVEDDEIDIELFKLAMKEANITNPLYFSYDGVEALKVLRETIHKDDTKAQCIIFVDINMPRMDGIEFLKTIRQDEHLKRDIVFMLTTSNRKEDKVFSYNLNVAGYILKNNLVYLTDMLKKYFSINEFSEV